jgi:hypothetical protein
MTRKCQVRFGGGTVEKRISCGSPLFLPYHDRLTNAQDDGTPGLQQLHSHVVLPGTAPTLEGQQAFYNNKDKGHEKLFHQVAAQNFEAALERCVGPEWRQLRQEPALDADMRGVDELEAWFPREREP